MLLFARDMKDIDNVLHRLTHKQGMGLEVEDDVSAFLGVHIECNDTTGEITMTQRGLIKRIINALGVRDLPAVDTRMQIKHFGTR